MIVTKLLSNCKIKRKAKIFPVSKYKPSPKHTKLTVKGNMDDFGNWNGKNGQMV